MGQREHLIEPDLFVGYPLSDHLGFGGGIRRKYFTILLLF